MTNMLIHFKARVLSIPARIARLLVGKTKFQEIYDTIMTEIELALRELAAYDPAMFAQQNAEYMASQGYGERNGDGNGEDGTENPVEV
jgi:hypothetical protein